MCSWFFSLEKSKVFLARVTTHVNFLSLIFFPALRKYYLGDLREEDKDIILMIQSDELAYRVPSENSQLAFPDKYVWS